MLVDVWIDLVCPWAYLGQDRSTLLRDLGFEVRSRPFELHPELPTEGRSLRPGGRLAHTFDRVATECATVGLPFRAPTRLSNSRAALEWTEAVAIVAPESHEGVVAALFGARFAEDLDPGDPEVRTAAGTTHGVDLERVDRLLADGTGGRRVDAARADATDVGVAATPAWCFENGFTIPGVQPRDQVRRWAGRVLERAGRPSEVGPPER